MNRAQRILTAFCAAVALAVTAAGCAAEDTDDCTETEARAYDTDCGYWADDGAGNTIFLWYVWVEPWKGGAPPTGTKPAPPPGAKVAKAPAKPPAPPPKPNKPAGGAPKGGGAPKPPPPPRPPVKAGRLVVVAEFL